MHGNVGFDTRIWALAQGGVDEELERHMANCERCQHQVATLRELARYARTTESIDIEPPPSLLTRMSGLMSQIRPDLVAHRHGTVGSSIQEAFRQVLATLVFDSGTSFQPVGLRGSVGSRTRQIVFESDVADLDLELSRSEKDGNAWSVVGQLGMDAIPSALTVSFVSTDRPASPRQEGSDVPDGVIQMEVSMGGHFRGTIPSGRWTAIVETGDAEVRFGEILV